MAIQANIAESQYGIPFSSAYFRIATAAVSRTRNANQHFSVMIDVVGYATQPQNEDTKEIDFRRYHVPLAEVEAQTGDSFLAKCYAWLMLQPNMADSTAV
jgi:dihydropteroate synthase